MRKSLPRDGKTFHEVTSGDVGSKPESSNTIDPDMERFYTSGSTAWTGRLVNMHAAEHGYSILYLDAENAYVRAEEDEATLCASHFNFTRVILRV